MVLVITKIQATGTTMEKKHAKAQHFDLSHFDIAKERSSQTGLDLQVVDQTLTRMKSQQYLQVWRRSKL